MPILPHMHIHLANSADLSSVPATVCATVAHKRGVTTEHDVQDHSQAPKITPLIVERGLLHEDFNHFGCHVLCRPTLGNQIQASFKGRVKSKQDPDLSFSSLYSSQLGLKAESAIRDYWGLLLAFTAGLILLSQITTAASLKV